MTFALVTYHMFFTFFSHYVYVRFSGEVELAYVWCKFTCWYLNVWILKGNGILPISGEMTWPFRHMCHHHYPSIKFVRRHCKIIFDLLIDAKFNYYGSSFFKNWIKDILLPISAYPNCLRSFKSAERMATNPSLDGEVLLETIIWLSQIKTPSVLKRMFRTSFETQIKIAFQSSNVPLISILKILFIVFFKN